MQHAEPTVEVRCQECGITFELSRRNEREHERLGMRHRCRPCRQPGARPSAEAIAEAKRWWLAHYTLDEIRSWPLT